MNVANVLLARAAGRGRDLAIRSALGASRSRLIQQTLVESGLLSLGGGIVGLGVMVLATRGILAVAPSTLPRISEVSPGWPVVVFALGLSMVTGLLVGLFPALTASRSQAQDSLRDGTRTTASRSRRRTRAALIVVEVALAMALTVGGGLLLRSFVSVIHVDPGFNPEKLLTMQVAVPARYSGAPSILTFYDELETRLKALPGVTAVGGTTRLPLGSTNVTTYLEVEGRPLATRRPSRSRDAPRGLRLLRDHGDPASGTDEPSHREDHLQAPLAGVVNEVLRRRLFPARVRRRQAGAVRSPITRTG